MSIRNNGTKRDPKRVLSALFLLFVAIVCSVITVKHDFKISWVIISLAVYFLAFTMFRSANEV